MRFYFILIIISISLPVFGQTAATFEPFDHVKYQDTKYHFRNDTVNFSKFKIITQQVSIYDSVKTPADTGCFAWLTIQQDNIPIRKLYYNTLESVGNCYGIFLPVTQPLKNYYFISVIGGYEGIFFILDTVGNFNEYDGGEIYISSDNHYLFSPSASDLPALTVVDLNSMKVVFSDNIEPYLGNWYFKDGIYFAEIDEFK
jgi:hypothetical protein